MKKRLPIKSIITLILVLGIAFLFLANPLFNLNFGLIRTTKLSVSKFILENARPIFNLQTVEYSVKTVFPFDYISSQDVYYSAVKKFSKKLELNEEEKKAIRLLSVLDSVGMSLKNKKKEFVILSLRLRAGYNLSKYQELDSKEFYALINSHIKYNYRKRTITFDLPDPEVVEIIIDDPDPETYIYPDISLSPREFKIVAEYVQEHIMAQDIITLVLKEAKENTKLLISELFLNNGWKEVIFEEDSEKETEEKIFIEQL